VSAPGAGQGISWVDVAASAAGIFSEMQAIGEQAAGGLARGMQSRLPGALTPVVQGAVAGAVEGAIGGGIGAVLEQKFGAEVVRAMANVGPTLRAAWAKEMQGAMSAGGGLILPAGVAEDIARNFSARVGATMRATMSKEMREAFNAAEAAAAAEAAGTAIAGGFAKGVGSIRQTIQTLFGGGLQTAATEAQALEAGQRIGRAVTGGLKQTLAEMSGAGGWLDTKQFEVAAADLQTRMMQFRQSMQAAQAGTAAAGEAEWARMRMAADDAAQGSLSAETAAQAAIQAVYARTAAWKLAADRVTAEATMRGLRNMVAAEAAAQAEITAAREAAQAANAAAAEKWAAVQAASAARIAAEQKKIFEFTKLGGIADQVGPTFQEAGRFGAEAMGQGFQAHLAQIAQKFVPVALRPAVRQFFGQTGREAGSTFTGEFNLNAEFKGIKYLKGWDRFAGEGAAEAANAAGKMSMAMKAGLAGLAVIAADVLVSGVRNAFKLVETEVSQFAKVGEDAAHALLGGFKAIANGEMPDIQSIFTVGLEGIKAGMDLPLNAIQGGLQAAVGWIPIFGSAITGAVAQVQSALGGLFSGIQSYMGIAGEFGSILLDIGNKWQEAARTIAGQTLGVDKLEGYLGVVKDVAASGDLVHFKDVAAVVGELSQRLSGLNNGAGVTREQVTELATTLAMGNELLGDTKINVDNLTAAFNSFDVPAEKTNQVLTEFINIARMTGADINDLTADIDTISPALQALGLGGEQAAMLMGLINEELGKPAMGRFSYSLARLPEQLSKAGMDYNTFVSVIQGYTKSINEAGSETEKNAIKMAAIDYAQPFLGSAKAAENYIDMIRKGIIPTQEAMTAYMREHGDALSDPIKAALDVTAKLGDKLEQLSNQVQAALLPLGEGVLEKLSKAGDGISAWLQKHQVEFIGWVGAIGEKLLDWGAKIAHFLASMMRDMAGMIEFFKNVVVGVLAFVDEQIFQFTLPWMALPDEFPMAKAMKGLNKATRDAMPALGEMARFRLDKTFEAGADALDTMGNKISGMSEGLAHLVATSQDAAAFWQAGRAEFGKVKMDPKDMTKPLIEGGEIQREAAALNDALSGAIDPNMFGAKGLTIDPTAWDQVVAQYHDRGIQIIGDKTTGQIRQIKANSQKELDDFVKYLNERFQPDMFAKYAAAGAVSFKVEPMEGKSAAEWLHDNVGLPSELAGTVGPDGVIRPKIQLQNVPPQLQGVMSGTPGVTTTTAPEEDKPKPPGGNWFQEALGWLISPLGMALGSFQYGGTVAGPGGTDNVLIRATAGEKVMSLGASQRFGQVLDAMNLQAFANGGTVLDQAGIPASMQAGSGAVGAIALPAGINVITPQPMSVSDTLVNAGIPDRLQGDVQQAGVTETGVSLPTNLSVKEASRKDAGDVMTAVGIPDKMQSGDGVQIDVKFNVVPGQQLQLGDANVPPPGSGPVTNQVFQAMKEGGFPDSEWGPLYNLIQGESSWNPMADNPSSHAFGLFQFLGHQHDKYGQMGGYSTNPYQQAHAGIQYIKDVYGSPTSAYQTWLSRSPHWYQKGGRVGLKEDKPVPSVGGKGYSFLGFAGGGDSSDPHHMGSGAQWYADAFKKLKKFFGFAAGGSPTGDVPQPWPWPGLHPGPTPGGPPGAPSVPGSKLFPWSKEPFFPQLPDYHDPTQPNVPPPQYWQDWPPHIGFGPIPRAGGGATASLSYHSESHLAPHVGLPVSKTSVWSHMLGGGLLGFNGGGQAGHPLFTSEGPEFYAAAYAHNRPWAKASGTNYQTVLSPEDEQEFIAWVKSGKHPFFDCEAKTVDYDMRGYWRSGGRRTEPHWPDTYKTPYDTSFSAESRYAIPGTPFKWQGDILVDTRDGSVVFQALAEGGGARASLSYHSESHLAPHVGLPVSKSSVWSHMANGGLLPGPGGGPGGAAIPGLPPNASAIVAPAAPYSGGTLETHSAVYKAFREAGFSDAQWGALVQLCNHENDTWDPNRGTMGPDSDAKGIFQFLSTTWATVGMSFSSDPYIQSIAGNRYAKQRYGDWIGAWAAWQRQKDAYGHNWWNRGGMPKGFVPGGLAAGDYSADDIQGVDAEILGADVIAHSMGLTLTSGKARHPVDSGYHPKGMAGDFSNSWKADTPEEARFATYMASNFKTNIAELIHATGPGWDANFNIKDGKFIKEYGGVPNVYDQGTLGGHHDHVHLAMVPGSSPALEQLATSGTLPANWQASGGGLSFTNASLVSSISSGSGATATHGPLNPVLAGLVQGVFEALGFKLPHPEEFWAQVAGHQGASAAAPAAAAPAADLASPDKRIVNVAAGGHIKGYHLPGRDTVPMLVPPGTFILNRHRSAQYRDIADNILGMAAGGMIPIITEPGERVFPPGSAPPGFLHAMNQGRLLRRQPGGGTDDNQTVTLPDGTQVILVKGPGKQDPNLPKIPAPPGPFDPSKVGAPPWAARGLVPPGTPGGIETIYGTFAWASLDNLMGMTQEEAVKYDEWLKGLIATAQKNQKAGDAVGAALLEEQAKIGEENAARDAVTNILNTRAKGLSGPDLENFKKTDAEYLAAMAKLAKATSDVAAAHDKVTKAQGAYGDAIRDQQLEQLKPAPWQGKAAETAVSPDANASALGAGLIKGMAQELGFGDVFGKPPWEWGIWKLFAGGASYAIGLGNILGGGVGGAAGAGAPGGLPGGGLPGAGGPSAGPPTPPGGDAAIYGTLNADGSYTMPDGTKDVPVNGGYSKPHGPTTGDKAWKYDEKTKLYYPPGQAPALTPQTPTPGAPDTGAKHKPGDPGPPGSGLVYNDKGELVPAGSYTPPAAAPPAPPQAPGAPPAPPVPPPSQRKYENPPGDENSWPGFFQTPEGKTWAYNHPGWMGQHPGIDQAPAPPPPAPPGAPPTSATPGPPSPGQPPGLQPPAAPSWAGPQTAVGPPIHWSTDRQGWVLDRDNTPVTDDPRSHSGWDPAGPASHGRRADTAGYVQGGDGGRVQLVSAVQSLGAGGDGTGTPQLASYSTATPMDWLMHPARSAMLESYQRGDLRVPRDNSGIAAFMRARVSQGPANVPLGAQPGPQTANFVSLTTNNNGVLHGADEAAKFVTGAQVQRSGWHPSMSGVPA
jgi:hypothetical protein